MQSKLYPFKFTVLPICKTKALEVKGIEIQFVIGNP